MLAINGLQATDAPSTDAPPAATGDTAPIRPMVHLVGLRDTVAAYRDLIIKNTDEYSTNEEFLLSFTNVESFTPLLLCYLDYSRLVDSANRHFPPEKDPTNHPPIVNSVMLPSYWHNWEYLTEVEKTYTFLGKAVHQVVKRCPEWLFDDTVLTAVKSFFEMLPQTIGQTRGAKGHLLPLLNFISLARHFDGGDDAYKESIKNLFIALMSNPRWKQCIMWKTSTDEDDSIFRYASIKRLEERATLFQSIFSYLDPVYLPDLTHLPNPTELKGASSKTLEFSDTKLFLYLMIVLLYENTPDAYTLYKKDGKYYLLPSDPPGIPNYLDSMIPSIEYHAKDREKERARKLVGVRLSADNLDITTFIDTHATALLTKGLFDTFFQEDKVKDIILFAILTENSPILNLVKQFTCEKLKRFLRTIYATDNNKIIAAKSDLYSIKYFSWDTFDMYEKHIKPLAIDKHETYKQKIQKFFDSCFTGESIVTPSAVPASAYGGAGGPGSFFMPTSGGAGDPGRHPAYTGAGAGGGGSAGAADAKPMRWPLGNEDEQNQPQYSDARIRFYENSLLCPLVLLQTIKALTFTVAKGSDSHNQLITASEQLSGGASQESIQATLGGNENVRLNACNRAYFNANKVPEGSRLGIYEANLTKAFGANNFTSYCSTNLATLKDTINQDCNKLTNGLIKEIVQQDLPSETVFGILNAIYFEAEWTSEFEADQVKPTLFCSADEDPKPIPLMFNEKYVPYCTSENGEYLILDYKAGLPTQPAYRIMFFKPFKGNALSTFAFKKGLQRMGTLVRFGIPEGTISMPPINVIPFAQRLGINGILESMPEIHRDVCLALWNVACKITFDKKGTTAAAASSGVGAAKGGSFGQRPIPIPFILDQPFVFCIFAEVPRPLTFEKEYVQLFTGEIKNASQIEPITA
ncbi:MAG: serpin family protein [bacterium]